MTQEVEDIDITYSTGFGDLVGLPRASQSASGAVLPLPEVREISIVEWLASRAGLVPELFGSQRD